MFSKSQIVESMTRDNARATAGGSTSHRMYRPLDGVSEF
jgi:hypothetical protein